MENETQDAAESIPNLGGINQRVSPSNLGQSDFELAVGVSPTEIGLLERVTGKVLLRQFQSAILQIHQTFDAQNHIIIQTLSNGVHFYTLDELLGRESTPSLSPVSIIDEDIMPQALIVDKKASGAAGSVLTTSYAARDLTDIAYQLNADGTSAGFIAGFNGTGGTAAKQFSLIAGTYRFDIQVAGSTANAATGLQFGFQAMLYNVTAGAPAFNGLVNQSASSERIGSLGTQPSSVSNVWLKIHGQLTLANTTIFEVRQRCTSATSTLQGNASSTGGENEIYAFVKITKTA